MEEETWTLYVDGSSNKKGNRARIVLEGLGHFQLDVALKFNFKTSNNQVEYEALIAGLLFARDMGSMKVICRSDSQLTVGHIKDLGIKPNWERPFRITVNLQNRAYKLETLDKKAIPRTWNTSHLKFYFS